MCEGNRSDPGGAVGAVTLHNPEIIENLAGAALRVDRVVEVADAMLDVRRNLVKGREDAAAI